EYPSHVGVDRLPSPHSPPLRWTYSFVPLGVRPPRSPPIPLPRSPFRAYDRMPRSRAVSSPVPLAVSSSHSPFQA
ncbi:hypothetical protein K488DRAFT_92806, partial [Vararia minispora EC-137]